MSADPLVDTFARYKKGTSRLIEWLCESARQCGIKIQPSTGGKTRVPTATLLAYTTQIIKNGRPKIEIPLAIIHVAQDVIAGRKLCHKFYTTFASQDDADNKRHKHFINILQTIHDDLRREYKSRLPKRKKQIPALANDEDDLTNLFSTLELQDTDISDEVTRDGHSQATVKIVQPTKTKGKQRKADSPPTGVQYEFGDEDEEARFAIWCLLEDFGQIRAQVQTVWQKYADGEISMMTATSLTSHAFILMKAVSSKFNKAHEGYASYTEIIDFIGIDSHMKALQEEKDSLKIVGSQGCGQLSTTPSAIKEDAESLLCIEAWQSLHDFQQLQFSKMMPQHEDYDGKRPGMVVAPFPFGSHLLNASSSIVGLMGTEGVNILREHSRLSPKWKLVCEIVDPYTELLCEITNTTNFVDATAVHSTQICFDIYQTLNGHVDRGLTEAIDIIEWAQHICDKALQLCEQAAVDDSAHFRGMSSPTFINRLHGIRGMVKQEQNKDGSEGWIARSCASTDHDCGLFIPLDLLRSIPLLAMHIAQKMLAYLQTDGLLYCNSDLAILSAAHLRNATTQFGCPESRWPDMDHFLSSQSNSFFRQGDGSMVSAAKQYSMALGTPLLALATGSGKKAKPTLPSAKRVFERSEKAIQINTMQDSCQAILQSGAQPFADDIIYEAIRRHATNSGMRNPIIAGQWEATKKLTTSQLLEVLLEIIGSEEKHLHFDYWSFANQCTDWLFNVAKLFVSENDRAHSWPIWEIVHDVLWDAAKVEEKEQPRKPTFLYRAGMELLYMLANKNHGPDALVKYSFEMSTGSIAEHRRPKIRYAGLEEAGPPKVVDILDFRHLNQSRQINQLEAWHLGKIGETMLTFEEWRDKHSGDEIGYRKYVHALLKPYSRGVKSDDLWDYVEKVIARREGKIPKILASQVLLVTSMNWIRLPETHPMAS